MPSSTQPGRLANMGPARAGFSILSCSANPEPGVLPELLARQPVCLALDWGQKPRPTYYARTAPDTLLLLPGQGERHGLASNARVWGRVALAASQQDREGGGWMW